MDTHLRRWGAVWILVAAWLVSSLLFGVAETFVQTHQAAQHGQPFEWSEFWPAYWSGMFENLQSEWAQLAVQAMLISALSRTLFRKGDEDLIRIEAKLDRALGADQ